VKIGIDACCWSNRRGFGRYTRELVTHILDAGSGHEFILFVDRQTAEACPMPTNTQLVTVDARVQPTAAAAADSARSPGDLLRFRRAVACNRPELFFFPAVYSFFPVPRRLPTIVTLHDAIAENHASLIFPNRKARWFWGMKMWLALRQATRILTVSECAKRQIIETFRLPDDRLRVILEGHGPEFRVLDEFDARATLKRYHLPDDVPLVLYVGGISPHKNLDGLLRSLDLLRRRGCVAWHVVIVGDYEHDSFHGCYPELCALRRELRLDNLVTFTGFVPNEDLVQLYNAATLLVLPSFSEGFGLPVVEAMACGLPVAASDRGSLPEVIGSAGVLFDPSDPDSIAAAIERL